VPHCLYSEQNSIVLDIVTLTYCEGHSRAAAQISWLPVSVQKHACIIPRCFHSNISAYPHLIPTHKIIVHYSAASCKGGQAAKFCMPGLM